jgi:hypothetical protein
MKLSKTAQWILTLGILVVLLLGAVIVYGKQRTAQGDLETALTHANQDFVRYSAQKGNLEARLSKANSDLSKLEKDFRLSTESVEIIDDIFDAADDSRIDIVSVSSSLPKSEKGAKGKAAAYDVFTMTIKAEGNVVALLKFSSKLGEAFPDSVINSVSIGVSEEEGKSTISMGLTIYCYESS